MYVCIMKPHHAGMDGDYPLKIRDDLGGFPMFLTLSWVANGQFHTFDGTV